MRNSKKWVRVTIVLSIMFIVGGIARLSVFSRPDENRGYESHKVLEENSSGNKVEINKRVQNRAINEIESLQMDVNNQALIRLIEKLQKTTYIEVTYDEFNYFEEDYKPAVITDSKHIQLILDLLAQGYSSQIKEEDMGGNYINNQPIVFYQGEEVLASLTINYDSLHHQGWVQYGEYSFQVGEDFFRILEAFEEYRPKVNEITEDVKQLFKAYGYTPAFLMGKSERKLPQTLEMKNIKDSEKLYFAMSLEMSKAIGLDYGEQSIGSNVLGEKVTIEIYHLVEPLPESAKPHLDARGIVLRYQGKIIGAHIDAGRHSGAMFTLSGKSFEEITGMTPANYLAKEVMASFERGYKSDEELITNYFKAQVKRDTDTYYKTVSAQMWLDSLFGNMDNAKLFREEPMSALMPRYYKKVDILDIKLSENNDRLSSNKTKIYEVSYRIETEPGSTLESGEYIRLVALVNEEGKWLIAGEGF